MDIDVIFSEELRSSAAIFTHDTHVQQTIFLGGHDEVVRFIFVEHKILELNTFFGHFSEEALQRDFR